MSPAPQNTHPDESGLPGASTDGIPVMKDASIDWIKAAPGIWVGEALSDEVCERIRRDYRVLRSDGPVEISEIEGHLVITETVLFTEDDFEKLIRRLKGASTDAT